MFLIQIGSEFKQTGRHFICSLVEHCCSEMYVYVEVLQQMANVGCGIFNFFGFTPPRQLHFLCNPGAHCGTADVLCGAPHISHQELRDQQGPAQASAHPHGVQTQVPGAK